MGERNLFFMTGIISKGNDFDFFIRERIFKRESKYEGLFCQIDNPFFSAYT